MGTLTLRWRPKLKRKSSHPDDSCDEIDPLKKEPASESEASEHAAPRRKRRKITLKFKRAGAGDVHKHLYNLNNILLNSNATPFQCKGIWYLCCFCPNKYSNSADVKAHTIERHVDKTKAKLMTDRTLVKLDITRLKCNCGEKFDTLDALTVHLTVRHDLKFHKDINNQILPFKFDSPLLKCVICDSEFCSFKGLLEHMNLHFPNYVCADCGNGFVSPRQLQVHGKRHKNGAFSCLHCSKVFNTEIRQKEHERQVHLMMNKRNKCGVCGEFFAEHKSKYEHEEEVHGVKRMHVQCLACERSFNNLRDLNMHKKTFHMMEYSKKPKKKKVRK